MADIADATLPVHVVRIAGSPLRDPPAGASDAAPGPGALAAGDAALRPRGHAAAASGGGPHSMAPRQRGPLERLGRTFWRDMDARVIVSPGDSREFVRRLRDADAAAPPHAASLPRLLGHIDEMQQRFDSLDLPVELQRSLCAHLGEMRQALQELEQDAPRARRAFWIAGASLMSAVLPLAAPLASKPRQGAFAAEMAGTTAKMLLEAGAMIGTPTAGFGLLKERWLARNMVNNAQGLWWTPALFKPAIGRSPAFSVAGSLVSAGLLFGVFMSGDIGRAVNRRWRGSAHPPLAGVALELGSPAPRELDLLHRRVNADMQALVDTKAWFEAGHELNPLVSKQVSLAVDAYRRLGEKLASALNLDPAGHGGQAPNPDFAAKLALAVFTGAVCFTGAALMYPDQMGVADLAADALFTTAYQASLVWRQDVSRTDALDEFKTFSGFSLVLIAMLGVNKAAHEFLDHGGMAGVMAGSIAMAALNLVLPGPIGAAAAGGIESLMNLDPRQVGMKLHQAGHHVYEWLRGSPPPAPASADPGGQAGSNGRGT
jgi:hypothetical protein